MFCLTNAVGNCTGKDGDGRILSASGSSWNPGRKSRPTRDLTRWSTQFQASKLRLTQIYSKIRDTDISPFSEAAPHGAASAFTPSTTYTIACIRLPLVEPLILTHHWTFD